MSEEKPKKKWYGWVKNIISAVAGAVISCAATIGIIGKDDATMAKEKIDGWMQKTDTVYVQVENVTSVLSEVKALIEEKKWSEAIAKLDSIKESAGAAIASIKELKDDISEAAKAVGEEAKEKAEKVKEKVDEVKETVKSAAEQIKEGGKEGEGAGATSAATGEEKK